MRAIVNYAAYFDASGHPSDSDVVTVGGIFAPAQKWQRFEREWQRCLDYFGVSALHMKDFAHSRRQFSSWKGDEELRRKFLTRLVRIIRETAWHTFGAGLLMADYREVCSERDSLRKAFLPLGICGGACLYRMGSWLERRHIRAEQVRCLFEDGDADKGNLMRVASHLGFSVQFLAKSQSAAFQAADLLAYEQFQYYRRRLSKDQLNRCPILSFERH